MSKPSKTVRVYPDPSGVFLDGIPAVEQDVPEADAEWMVRSGAFILTAPVAAPIQPAAEAAPIVTED